MGGELIDLFAIMLWGAFGLWLWTRFVRASLPDPEPLPDGHGLVGLFVLALSASILAQGITQGVLTDGLEDPEAGLGFAGLMRVLTVGNALGVALIALVAWRQEPLRDALGLAPSPTRLPVLTAVAAFLMTRPLLVVGSLISYEFVSIFRDLPDEPAQELVQLLAAAEGEPTLTSYLVICVVIPFAEELLFRGALFGGLRTRMGFWPAATISGVVFGLLHADLLVLLPLTLLGLRERTGSLTVPFLLHGLNNWSAIELAESLR